MTREELIALVANGITHGISCGYPSDHIASIILEAVEYGLGPDDDKSPRIPITGLLDGSVVAVPREAIETRGAHRTRDDVEE